MDGSFIWNSNTLRPKYFFLIYIGAVSANFILSFTILGDNGYMLIMYMYSNMLIPPISVQYYEINSPFFGL